MPFASDTFTDTAGTTLQSHTATLGGPWVKHAAATGDAQISASGRAYVPSSVVALYYLTADPGTDEYDVECDVVNLGETSQGAGVCGRMSTSAATFYMGRYNLTVGAYELYKCVGGTFTLLGTYTATLTTGSTATLKLAIRNATKKLYVDGVERISSTDNSVTGNGRAGLRIAPPAGSFSTTGLHVDNLTASISAQTLTPAVVTSTSGTIGQPVVVNAPNQAVTPAVVTSTATVGQPVLTLGPAPVYPDPTSGYTVQVCDLATPTNEIVDADMTTIAQWEDLSVTHPLNDGRTAQVTISMHDAIAGFLAPFQFALRVLHPRGECVFFGQAWFEEDYAAGTLTIYAQDPSLRLQHHYVRLGDTVMDDGEVGHVPPDSAGIFLVVDAARNTEAQNTRGDPDIGIFEGDSTPLAVTVDPVEVERGQECWDIIQQVAAHNVGPDFDLRPVWSLPSSNYVNFDCYTHLGTDRGATLPDTPAAGEVVFDHGLGADNADNVIHRPGRPTTHAHVVDGSLVRRSAGNTTGSTETGVFVDWVPVDWRELYTSGGNLTDVAQGRVEVYGRPPKFFEIVLRPDAVQTSLYGHPDYPLTPGQFYVGDTVTVRAVKGNRSFTTDARIESVTLTVPGAHGPAVTSVSCVPMVVDTAADEEQ